MRYGRDTQTLWVKSELESARFSPPSFTRSSAQRGNSTGPSPEEASHHQSEYENIGAVATVDMRRIRDAGFLRSLRWRWEPFRRVFEGTRTQARWVSFSALGGTSEGERRPFHRATLRVLNERDAAEKRYVLCTDPRWCPLLGIFRLSQRTCNSKHRRIIGSVLSCVLVALEE